MIKEAKLSASPPKRTAPSRAATPTSTIAAALTAIPTAAPVPAPTTDGSLSPISPIASLSLSPAVPSSSHAGKHQPQFPLLSPRFAADSRQYPHAGEPAKITSLRKPVLSPSLLRTPREPACTPKFILSPLFTSTKLSIVSTNPQNSSPQPPSSTNTRYPASAPTSAINHSPFSFGNESKRSAHTSPSTTPTSAPTTPKPPASLKCSSLSDAPLLREPLAPQDNGIPRTTSQSPPLLFDPAAQQAPTSPKRRSSNTVPTPSSTQPPAKIAKQHIGASTTYPLSRTRSATPPGNKISLALPIPTSSTSAPSRQQRKATRSRNMSGKPKSRLRAKPITCDSVNNLLFVEQNSEHPILLVDVRPFSDFVVGHIATAYNVTLSSMMLRRLHQRKIPLLDLIKEDQREEFQQKLEKDNVRVIVYDTDTKFADDVSLNSKNALHVIVNWLQEANYDTVYLQGGFQEMRANFEVVENPHTHSHQPSGLALKISDGSPSPSVTTPIERHKCEKEPTAILEDLYVGAEDHASNAEVIKRLGITHILNVTTRAPQNRHDGVQYMFIEILDSWNQDLISHFEPAFDFIDEARKAGGVVLIHCMAGISRSPTVAIGYLMKTMQISLSKAYQLVKSKRTSIAPNLDFMGELEMYEQKLKAENPNYEATGWEEERRSASLLREGQLKKSKLPSAKGGLTITIPPRTTE